MSTENAAVGTDGPARPSDVRARLEDELTAEAMALITTAYDNLDGLMERADALAERAAECGFDRIRALARLGRAEMLSRTGRMADGLNVTQDVLRWADSTGDLLVTARGHALLSTGLQRLGAWAESLPHAQAGVRLLDDSAPLAMQADHALILAMMTSIGGTVASALFDRADELARALGDPVMVIANLNNLAYLRCERGDVPGAFEAVERLRAVAAANGRQLNAAVIDTVALVLMDRGQSAEAERLIDEALSRRVKYTDADSFAGVLLTYAELKLRAGDHMEALRAAERSRKLSTDAGLGRLAALALQKLAAIHAAMGDHRAAYDHMVDFHTEWERVRTADGDAVASVTRALFEFEQVRREGQRYRELAEHDPLTGLWNRRYLESRLDVLLQDAPAAGPRFVLCLIDLDHFKQVNDRYTHDAGDAVLRVVAGILDQACGPEAFAVRLGGEEFVVVFVNSSQTAAIAKCEQMRRTIAGQPWPDHGVRMPVTASIGVTVALRGDTISTLLRRADKHLYQAKRAGRNQVDAAT